MIRPHRSQPSPPRSASTSRVVLAVLVVSVLAAACSHADGSTAGEDDHLEGDRLEGDGPGTTEPLEVPVVTLPPGFEVGDTSGVELAPFVAANPAVPAAIEVLGGTARLGGVVRGPDGPVAGATVQLERFADGQAATLRIPTRPDGTFDLKALEGGRYRVRAWSAPDLTTTRSTTHFLAAEDAAVHLAIDLERHDRVHLTAGVEAARFEVGDLAEVRAVLTREVVDGDGIVVEQPAVGAEVRLSGPGLAVTASRPNPGRTDGAGQVAWEIECRAEGVHAITLSHPDVELVLDAPPCLPATSSQEPDPELPIGGPLPVPAAGPVPAGTYVAEGSGCSLTYQRWGADGWEPTRRQGGGQVFVLTAPARTIQPTGSAPGCAYLRVA